jgi:hypothetical protein
MKFFARRSLLIASLAGGLVSTAAAQSLTTAAPNNGSGGIFMDLTPVGAALQLDSFATYFSSASGTPVSVEVWTRPGSYVGFTTSNTGWTLSQTVAGVSAGTATAATVPLTTAIILPSAATTAVYLHAITAGGGIRYTGTSAAPPQTTWSNADVQLFSDVARTGAVAFAGTANTPRTFAGTINYSPFNPLATGACCFTDGSCQELTLSNCTTQGGTFRGANVVCGSANCPQPGACCFGDGTCTFVQQGACTTAGGVWSGASITCAAANCPQPGACCFASGSCSFLLESACTAQGGTFSGVGVTCAAANCPQPPTGACCLPDSTCVIVWQGGCTAQGGVYAGNNSTCANPNCLNVVVPNANATVEGTSSNSFPFTATATHFHYQQVYAANNFAALSGPHSITAMHFRPNATSTAPVWENAFTLNLRLSTTTAGPDTLSATFADNVGGDEAVVYDGPITISTEQVTPISPGPAFFDVVINFQTPFIYDPSRGNLLVNLTRDGGTIGTNRFLDAVTAVGDAVGRVTTSTVGATTGTVSSIGLVTRFVLEPAAPPACYPNCDESTTAPVLNVQDFTCFLQRYAAGESYANCDNSTVEPVLNVQDFTCFLQAYAAGCP